MRTIQQYSPIKMAVDIISNIWKAEGLCIAKSLDTSRLQQLKLFREYRGCLREPGGNFTLVRKRPARIRQSKFSVHIREIERSTAYKSIPVSTGVSVSRGTSFPFSSRARSN